MVGKNIRIYIFTQKNIDTDIEYVIKKLSESNEPGLNLAELLKDLQSYFNSIGINMELKDMLDHVKNGMKMYKDYYNKEENQEPKDIEKQLDLLEKWMNL